MNSASASQASAVQTTDGQSALGQMNPLPSVAAMASVKTHLQISPRWVGEPVALSEGEASARLLTTSEMVADARGLVHGGFTFGLADYAAMLAVNDPFVVLGAAATKFLAPVRVGQTMLAQAKVLHSQGKKRSVAVTVEVDSSPEPTKIFEGEFTCFVLPSHVLGPEP